MLGNEAGADPQISIIFAFSSPALENYPNYDGKEASRDQLSLRPALNRPQDLAFRYDENGRLDASLKLPHKLLGWVSCIFAFLHQLLLLKTGSAKAVTEAPLALLCNVLRLLWLR